MASAMFLSDLDCSVCREEFTEPKLLPCNHRVCKKCLLSWLQEEGKGGCPLCRAPIHPESEKQKAKSADITSLVDDLPTDLVTMAIVASRKALSGSDVCGICDVSVAATSFCIQCSLKLCTQCATGHGKIPSTRDHVLEDLGKLTTERVAASHCTPCDAHSDKTAELYCWHHHTLVCLLCATTKHKECGGRGVEGVDEVAKKERPALRDQTNRLRQLEHDIDQQTARLEQEIRDAQAHFIPLKTDAMATFDRLHKNLDKRLQEIVAAIESQEDKVVKEKKAEKQALDQQRSAMVSQVRILDQMLDSSPDSALIGMLHKLKARLDELENQPRPERASSGIGLSKVVFDSQRLATLERDIAGLGQVTEDKPKHRCKCGAVRISSGVKLCGKCDKPAVQPDTQMVGRRIKRLVGRQRYGDGTIIQQGTGGGRHGDGWVKVKWDNVGVGWHRMGAGGVYELKFA